MATSTTFEYTDPRSLDGTPFDVATAACEQVSKVLEVAVTGANDAFVMARVAEMERQIQAGEEPRGSEFEQHPLGVNFLKAAQEVTYLSTLFQALARAAGYNPRNPPKELTDGK